MKWLAALLPLVALAQEPLSLRDAVAEALARHPALGAAAGRISVSEGERRQAALPPNPSLVLQSENTRLYGSTPAHVWWRDSENFAFLQNVFETAGKRARRTEAAAVAVQRAEAELEVLRRRIAGQVALAYWQAAGNQRLYTLLLENQENFNRIVTYHEARVQEGAMAEVDLLRVRLEAERLTMSVNNALMDAERARLQLLREMGRTEFPPVRLEDPIEDVSPPVIVADERAALLARPEIRAAQTSLAHASALARLQQSLAKPNIQGLFGYKAAEGFNTVIGGVQFELPVFDRNQGNIAAAAAAIRTAQRELEAVEAAIRAEVRTAARDYELRLAQLQHSLRPLVDKAREVSEIAQAAYLEGGTDLLRLLDAERVRIEAEMTYTRGLAELKQSQVQLRLALGKDPL
jgi:cobalt-zinc-cadmium efflux system outer membrane protein